LVTKERNEFYWWREHIILMSGVPPLSLLAGDNHNALRQHTERRLGGDLVKMERTRLRKGIIIR